MGFSNVRTAIRRDLDKKISFVNCAHGSAPSNVSNHTQKNEDNKKLTNATGCYKERVVNLSELKEKLDSPDFFLSKVTS